MSNDLSKEAKSIVETIESRGGADYMQDIINVLEDGEALKSLGITDQEHVEEAHDWLLNTLRKGKSDDGSS